jgi:antitoxin (DNA-binding transcriptional repressor) of toxin-antitoxin stability system
MKTVAIDNTPLAGLLEEIKKGEEVILTSANHPVAKVELLPVRKKIQPRAGTDPGIWMAPDFDAPLEDFKEYME